MFLITADDRLLLDGRLAGVWTDDVARAFTADCVRWICELALGSVGGPLDELEHLVLDRVRSEPSDALAFAADAVALSRGRRPEEWSAAPFDGHGAPSAKSVAANLGFVLAHAAGCLAADYHVGFAAERRRQQDRLVDLLTGAAGGSAAPAGPG
jgi:hypothetical protein